MPTVTRTSPHVDATHAFGAAIAHVLRAGDVVLLRGELGAGKTALVRGIAQGLGIAGAQVSSPTFVVVNEYPAAGPIRSLIHVDAYRVSEIGELENAGWDRLFDASGAPMGDAAAVIEWPERIASALPAIAAAVTLSHTGVESRSIELTVPESWLSRADCDVLLGRPPVKCPVTGRWVAQTARTYPFVDARARDADLYQWLVANDEE
ncbi:MAG: tRNA (adenosine(37)-N6)-threonylcarbamoyltransferase complex ATPase subunit type 1 TsaE [Planctomycetes bacterium]|nr:tRNA (adenosine(37)-N6)-threonylcarbamoyltransferase complex ATPase subunit type 1 TsaE [Planctomycetota bacterium]